MSIPLSTLLAFFLLLPGLIWTVWFKPKGDFISRLTDVIGISLAIPALIGLATFLFGWRFSGMNVIWLYGLVGILALFPFIRRKNKFQALIPNIQYLISNYQLLISSLVPLLLFLLLLLFRFYQARSLALPAWVDSVHHTLIVRLFLETGGVPPTAEPYINVPFYYHFGFHLNTALFAFFARLSPEQAVLIFGQFLNAFVSLAIYRLGMALWQDWRKASVALILSGFVFQMPGYYLTWGRYTLLTGLGIMILAMAATLDVIRNPRERTPLGLESTARLVLYIAGVLISHYYAAGLLALFFVMIVVEQIVFGSWQVWRHEGVQKVFIAGLVGLLVAAPWVWHVWVTGQRYFGVNVVAPTESPDTVYFSGYLEYLWFLMGPYRSHVMAGLGLVALFFVGWRDRIRPFAVWTVAFVLLSLPWGLQIRPFRPDHGAILVFFPASLLIADAFVTPLNTDTRWFRWLARGAFAAALLALTIWGVKETRDVLNSSTILASQVEVNALEWIEENTPEDANFFINVTYWQTGAYRGVDGGWWIMPLTGRKTFLPPALFLFGLRDNVKATNALAERAAQFNACTDEFRAFLQENELSYVYTGPSQGSLRPAVLENCQGLRVVYAQDGVMIYEVSLP